MSLAATKILDMTLRNPEFSSNEVRLRRHGALDFFIEQTNEPGGAVTQAMQAAARESIGSTLRVPVLKFDGTTQLLTQRSCTIPCSPSTSDFVTVQFNTLGFGICMNPDEYHNNYISYNQDYDFKYREGVNKLLQEMDSMCVTALDTYKTQVLRQNLGYTFTGNTVSASFNKRLDIMSDVNIMMDANGFDRRPLHIVGNSGVQKLYYDLRRLGPDNAINYREEYADKLFHFTENIQNDTNQFATFFAMEPGNVGLLYRFPRVALQGREALGRSWDIINLPIANIPATLQYYPQWQDLSAIDADMTCDLVEAFGFYVDFAIVTKYVSDPATLPTPDIKVQVAGSPQDGSGVPVYVTNTVNIQEVTP